VPNFVVDVRSHAADIKANLSSGQPEEVNDGRGFHNHYRYLAAGKTVLIDAFYDAWDRDPRDSFKLLGEVASAVQDAGILDKT
jgi:hypothetical protein